MGFIIECNTEQPDKEGHRGQGVGEGVEGPPPLHVLHSPQIPLCSPAWKHSEPQPLEFLWRKDGGP